MFATALVLQIILAEAAAIVAGRSVARRIACAALLIAGLPVALLLCPSCHPPQRATLSFLGLLAIMNSTTIALSNPVSWPLSRRAWQALMMFDVRHSRPAKAAWDGAQFTIMICFLALSAAMIGALAAVQRLHGPGWTAARLACGVVFVYSALETASSLFRFAHQLLGIEVPFIQKTPVLSRTVGEFWSERWNPRVSQWLVEIGFRSFARRGHAVVGVLGAFLVSAAIHGWLFGVALGWWAAISAMSFFVLQVPVLWAERRLAVRRWPEAGARAWTLTVLLCSSPLFVAPLLVGIGSNL